MSGRQSLQAQYDDTFQRLAIIQSRLDEGDWETEEEREGLEDETYLLQNDLASLWLKQRNRRTR